MIGSTGEFYAEGADYDAKISGFNRKVKEYRLEPRSFFVK